MDQQLLNQPLYNQQQPPIIQPATTPLKKKRRGWLIAGNVIAVLLFGCIIATLASCSGASTTTNSTVPSTQPTRALSGAWKTTHMYSGNGVKKTESFMVGDNWKIAWTCKSIDIGGTQSDTAFSIAVEGLDNTPIDIASTLCKAGQTTKNSIEEHKGSKVYLVISGTSEWTVEVQELK